MRRFALFGCVMAALLISLPTIHAASPDAKDAAKPAEKAAVKDVAKPEAKAVKPQAKKETKPSQVVVFRLNGNYPEAASAPGALGELKPTLALVIKRMDEAAADKNVAAVWLKIEDMAIGRAKLFEIRGAIARVRKAGKPVYAELTSADTAQYLVATACDRVVMPSSGMLLVPGVRAEVTFYKGLLDKLGLQYDVLKMGKYKGAAEPMTRTEMSKPLRESYEAMVDDNYQQLLTTVAADRHLKDYEVKTHLDHGIFSPCDAKKAGLIDDILYSDELQETIRKKIGVDAIKVVTDYNKQKIDADFSGLSGLMKLVELFSGGRASKSTGKKPKIAVVYAVGQIVEGKSSSDMFGNSALGSTSLIAAIRKAGEDPKVAAVVLRVDSPGGSATASDLIWRETQRLKQPMIASMGDVAASGGYYISMGAKKIYAAPGTLTGSIGVIGGKLVTKGLYDKLGLNTEVIARGANSGSLSSSQPFSEAERKVWTETLQQTYHEFVSKAAEGRKMTFNKLEAMAQGRVYTGETAKKLGLVDELGTLEDAIAAAKKAAGLKADADVDLLVLPEAKSFFEQLFGGEDAAVEKMKAEIGTLFPESAAMVRQGAMLRQMFSHKILTWMPYSVEIK